MNEVEKKELDTEAKDICKDICNNVLQRVIDENGITDLGTCGIDMSEPENIVMVAMAIEASSDKGFDKLQEVIDSEVKDNKLTGISVFTTPNTIYTPEEVAQGTAGMIERYRKSKNLIDGGLREALKEIKQSMEVVPDQASDLNEEVDSKRIREALLRHCKTSRDQLTEAGINLEGL
jgi:hypothetical protein